MWTVTELDEERGRRGRRRVVGAIVTLKDVTFCLILLETLGLCAARKKAVGKDGSLASS